MKMKYWTDRSFVKKNISAKQLWILFMMLFCFGAIGNTQDLKKIKLYKPAENAEDKIREAQQLARKEGKHIFIQVGGNWCIWCARFNELLETDRAIDSVVRANYVVYHLNYSPENRNEKLLEKYRFPQRFGFPVFLVLDADGKLIHTQNSGYLEQGKGYDTKAILGFLNDWSPRALDPGQYKDKT
jgi:thioredoxin-related protein